LRPDLFIDLADNTKSHAMTMFTRAKVFRYKKLPSDTRPIRHATANFLDTIAPICKEYPEPLFPTIFPEAIADHVLEPLWQEGELPPMPLIGIVPGVGKLRPHRAWLQDGWTYLLEHILTWQSHLPVLIGGPDEEELCTELSNNVGGHCLNTAGKLSLVETAAVLKRCRIVVSGDTGPAHVAIAAGTPVVGLYGPTYPQRSGPYGCMDLVLDQSEACRCHELKSCRFVNPQSPGECMSRIMLFEITEKLKQVLHPDSLEELGGGP
ncbi:MAG: glycosyltransferase family 9 protein, partial [Terriglobales bacterium]